MGATNDRRNGTLSHGTKDWGIWLAHQSYRLRKLLSQNSPQQTSKPSPQRPVRAELVWDGKYDADGKRASPLRVALPFQTVETVNESVQERQRATTSRILWCFRRTEFTT